MPQYFPKIWIDLDNTPHVPFFNPIIRELESRGYEIVITARDAFQVRDLADSYGLKYRPIGSHAGRSSIKKIASLVIRCLTLLRFAIKHQPVLSVSHGARSQIMASNFLRIPSVEFIDYEHVVTPPFCQPKWEIVPESYDRNKCRVLENRVRMYEGQKENVYSSKQIIDHQILESLAIEHSRIVVVVRPPATEAHYHNSEADVLCDQLLTRILNTANTVAIVLPRNRIQGDRFKTTYHSAFRDRRMVIPSKVIDGLSLIHQADLVAGGGGTMTREAAALGIPSYSFFRGPEGSVDRQLEGDGRLVMIRTPNDVVSKIVIDKKPAILPSIQSKPKTLETIITHLEEIIKLEYPIS